MLADTVNHLINSDGFKLFGLCCALMEHLSMKVIEIVLCVQLSFSEQYHNIDTLLQLRRG